MLRKVIRHLYFELDESKQFNEPRLRFHNNKQRSWIYDQH